MTPENYNPDCRKICPRFQNAKARDKAGNAVAELGWVVPSLGVFRGESYHFEEQAVGEDTFGCPGPKITKVPNNRFLHRALGIGTKEITKATCQAPDAKK